MVFGSCVFPGVCNIIDVLDEILQQDKSLGSGVGKISGQILFYGMNKLLMRDVLESMEFHGC